jgi:hypothetical protein
VIAEALAEFAKVQLLAAEKLSRASRMLRETKK